MWVFWILVVIGFALLIYSWTGDGWQGAAGMCSTFFLVIAINMSGTHINPKPTALDVYQGNTELEITSVNGVPTDTVVVFKK